ncbi:TIR domain-containing protein [Phormidesmis sp. 146-35]
MPEAPSYDVFVSYAEADRAWVEGYLLAALEQAGVRCMYESAFALGVPRLLEFERSIQQSKRTLLVISPNYLADGLNEFITTLGQSYGQDTNTWPVIPLIRQSVPLPPRLGMLVGLKATNAKEQESAIAQLCADLKRPLPTPAPPPDCPYPGMKPFGLDDRDRFFGREEEVNQLLEHLRLHPFITVIGPSGSGKSSLVFAGLIPALRESRLFASGGWQIQSMRPGETPQTALKQALASGAQQQAARMLLIVDQFEELFTLAKEEAIPFQENLLKLVKTPNVYLVLTVRADFYADLMTSLLWQEIQSYRLEVVPLDETGLREAILKPAEAVGVFVEPALVERLVRDAAGEPGVLPLIQETLVLLWQRLERRFLPLRAYEALVLPRTAYGGQESGQKTGLLVAIARRADQAIKDLNDKPEKQVAIARRIFLRLIQFGEGRADTRRQQSIEALRAATDDPALFNKTLAHLVTCRLLTPSGEENQATRKIDIAHEALIIGWPRLQKWITERRTKEEVRRRLTIKTEEWSRFGRGMGGLLDLVALSEAEDWLSSPDADDLGYDEGLPALIIASRKAIEEVERQKQEVERQKQEQAERELQLTQERLKQEKKARRSLQGMLGAVGLTGIVAVGTAIYMFRQSVNDQIQTITSRSENLLAANKDFDALIEELKAAQLVKQWSWILRNSSDVSVSLTLQQSLYKVKEQNRLLKHHLAVNSISFSLDGQQIASASDDGTIQLWNKDGSPSLNGRSFEGHSKPVKDISFGSRQLIGSASKDGTVRLWDTNGTLSKILSGHNRSVESLSFSRETGILASASLDGTVIIWNSSNGARLKTLRFRDPSRQTLTLTDVIVTFSSDGKKLAVASSDGEIRLWQINLKNYKTRVLDKNIDLSLISRFKVYDQGEVAISFSPDSMKLAYAGKDGIVKIQNLTNKSLRILKPSHKEIEDYDPNQIRVWNTRIKFSPDGESLATNTTKSAIRLWNLKNGTSKLLNGHSDGVTSLAFSPDGRMLASGGIDNSIRLWNLSSIGLKLMNFDEHIIGFNPLIEKVALKNPDDGIAAISDFNGSSRLKLKDSISTRAIVISPDGNTIAGSNNNYEADSYTVQIWDSSGYPRCSLRAHTYAITGVNFSPDNKLLISTGENSMDSKSNNNIAILWDVNSCQKISIMTGHKNSVMAAKFSSKNDLIMTASADGTAKLWNKSGKEILTLEGHTDQVNDVSFSPDGQRMATASSDSTIRIWNRNGHEAISPLKGHIGRVNSIVFSPDGTLLASAGQNGSVRLWSNNGQEIKTIEIGGNEIQYANFSSDGKFLYVREENTISRQNLDLEVLIVQGCNWLHDYLKYSSDSQKIKVQVCTKI